MKVGTFFSYKPPRPFKTLQGLLKPQVSQNCRDQVPLNSANKVERLYPFDRNNLLSLLIFGGELLTGLLQFPCTRERLPGGLLLVLNLFFEQF